MHKQAADWVAKCVAEHGPFRDVIEIGGMDINGSIRGLFTDSIYLAVDIQDGPGVDLVGDAVELAALGVLPSDVDCVVSTEALEHYPTPEKVIDTALRLLRPGGVLVATMAGPGRAPHSGRCEGPPAADEHYQNIDPDGLRGWLAGFAEFEVDVAGTDVRCWARR